MRATFAIVLLVPSVAWAGPCGPSTPGWVRGSCPASFRTFSVGELYCEEHDHGVIVCEHTGPRCKAIFAKWEARHKRVFGCAIPTEPNYPCPPWPSDEETKLEVFEQMRCAPLSIFPYEDGKD